MIQYWGISELLKILSILLHLIYALCISAPIGIEIEDANKNTLVHHYTHDSKNLKVHVASFPRLDSFLRKHTRKDSIKHVIMAIALFNKNSNSNFSDNSKF